MDQFLKTYLLVTGISAFIAIIFTPLAFLGLFLLILPGAFLIASPTLFIYGLAFSAVWFPLRLLFVGGTWAALAGIAACIMVGVGIPHWVNHDAVAAFAHLHDGDRMPAEPIRLSGSVRLEIGRWTQMSHWKNPTPYPCDTFCAALLFTPGVSSVTMADFGESPIPGDPTDRDWTATYRIVETLDCDREATRFPEVHVVDWFASRIELLTKWWAFSVARGQCIKRIDGPPPRPDWTLRIEIPDTDPQNFVFAGRANLTRVSLDGPGGRLLQQTTASGHLLAPVLFFEPYTAFPMPGVGLLPATTFKSTETIQIVETLVIGTNIGFKPEATSARAPTCDALREAVGAALDNPTLGSNSAALSLVPTLVQSANSWGIAGPGRPPCSVARPGDVALFTRLLDDPRPLNLLGLDDTIAMLGSDAVALREPIVSRALRVGRRNEDYQEMDALGKAVGKMPVGIFTAPTRNEERLLADREKRSQMPELISRQADRGAAAAPGLVQIVLDHHLDRDHGRGAPVAAMQALCRIGSPAGEVLPSLVAIVRDGLDPWTRSDGLWEYTMMRLGMTREAVDVLLPERKEDTYWLDRRLHSSSDKDRCRGDQ